MAGSKSRGFDNRTIGTVGRVTTNVKGNKPATVPGTVIADTH
jgi:hypothetical protein